MNARLIGLVIVEHGQPEPQVMVKARMNGERSEYGKFFDDLAEARQFACKLAEQSGAMLFDMTAAAEGAEH